MAKFAADILMMIKITDFRKHTIDRKDVVTLIDVNAAAYGLGELTMDDKDFIAYMITSSETPNFAWVLDQPAEKNRLLEMESLYSKIAQITEDDYDQSLGVYNAMNDKVMTMEEYVGTRSGNAKKGKGTPNEEGTSPSDAANFLTYGAMRQLDHILSLLMDQTIWDDFVPARDSQQPQLNVLRAEGLRTFAAYIHAVLLHPHLISAHAFLNTYNQLGTWLAPLPELEPHIKRNFDAIVLKHDYLNASHDAKMITDVLTFPNHDGVSSSLHGYPTQLLRIYGISKALQKSIDLAKYAALPISIESLRGLSDQEIQFSLLGLPIGRHTAIRDVSKLVIIGELASKQMQNSIASMNEGNSRFFTDEISDLLKKVSIVCSLEPLVRIDPISDPTRTTSSSVISGALHYSRGRAITDYSYDYFLRHEGFLKIYASEGLIKQFLPTHFTNTDLAQKMRFHGGIFDQTLLPSWLGKTGSPITRQSLLGDRDSLNAITTVLERISGHSLMYTLQTLAAPLAQEKWATTLSSFALLYVSNSAIPLGTGYTNSKDTKKAGGAIVNLTPADLGLTLVKGYGYPYGCDYDVLESKQTSPFSDSVIQLNEYVFIRLLDVAPLPTNKLALGERFGHTLSYYYATSNSEVKKIEYLLFGESLLNFTMFPIPGTVVQEDSKVLYDRYYTYFAQQYFLLTDMHESPMVDKNDRLIDFSLVAKDWKYEKLSLFTEFITFPPYSKKASAASASTEGGPENNVISNLIKEAESAITQTEQNANAASSGGGSEKVIKTEHIEASLDNSKEEHPKKAAAASESQKKEESTSKTNESVNEAMKGLENPEESEEEKEKKKKKDEGSK
jgi:hypothetical protein